MAKTKHLVYKMTTYTKYGKKEKTGHGFLDSEKNILFLGTGRYKYVDGLRKEIFIPITKQSDYFSPISGKSGQYKGIYYNPIEYRAKNKSVIMRRRKNDSKVDSNDVVLPNKLGKKFVYSSKPVTIVRDSTADYGSTDIRWHYDNERKIHIPYRPKKSGSPKSKSDIAFKNKSGTLIWYEPAPMDSISLNKGNAKPLSDFNGTVVYQNQYIWFKFKDK